MAIQLNGQEIGPIKFTDDKPGKTIHVGPATPNNPVDGDVWIDSDALNNAGKNLIQTVDLSTGGASKTLSISSSYKDFEIIIRGLTVTQIATMTVLLNGDVTASYADAVGTPQSYLFSVGGIKPSITTNHLRIVGIDITDSTSSALARMEGVYTLSSTSLPGIFLAYGVWTPTSVITSVVLNLSAGAFSGGTVLVYGVN